MNWNDSITQSTLTWLLEPEDPGVRYLALRDLMDYSNTSPELLEAQVFAHRNGPIACVLDKMDGCG